jgi:anti-sigma B factor antagonist
MKAEAQITDSARFPGGEGGEGDTLLSRKPALCLEFENVRGAMVLHCEGRILSGGGFRALSTIVSEVLPSVRRMVIDLAGLDSIDSGGLGEMVMTYLWAAASGYSLKFASPKKSVRRLLESSNLVSVFDVYTSVSEAVAAMVPDEVRTA